MAIMAFPQQSPAQFLGFKLGFDLIHLTHSKGTYKTMFNALRCAAEAR